MSICRITTVLTALATAIALASSAHAQLAKPFAFPQPESDFQFFAPGEIDTYGGGPTHKTGWFATYNRIYMNVQRPEQTFGGYSEAYGDFTWGNRLDLGFVDDDCRGWTCTLWHVDGPNLEDIVTIERINRAMADGIPDEAAISPLRDNNGRLLGERDWLVTNSVNVADMTGAELNRTWLWKPLHHGARLQPLIGLRYTRFIDFYQRQTYTRYDDDGFVTPPSGIPPVDALTATTEQVTSLDAGVTNDMLGGQLGMHWDKDYRQWNFSGDCKFFAMQNFQTWDQKVTNLTTIYGGALPQEDTTPDTVLITRTGTDFSNQEFVFGMEVRFDAAYRVTRDLSVNFTSEFIDFGKGIGRGINPNNTAQDVIMYGFGLGVTYNR